MARPHDVAAQYRQSGIAWSRSQKREGGYDAEISSESDLAEPERRLRGRRSRHFRLALLWDGSALTRSVEPAVSHYGPQPTQPVPACSRGAELGAIQICRALAVNSKFPCRHQLLGHDTATTYHGLKVNERLWPYSCSYVPYVCQRMRRRLGHRQSTALARQKREDDA